jgi:anti-sigma regulatory factor (Ser/Thr protein kinase)
MSETHTLPAEPMSASLARRVVAAVMPAEGETTAIALLLTSEVVTNAVLHARTPAELTVHCEAGVLRVAVADGSRLLPVVKSYDRTAVTGRGLQLVAELADRWGVEFTDNGKVVWFELELQGAQDDG